MSVLVDRAERVIPDPSERVQGRAGIYLDSVQFVSHGKMGKIRLEFAAYFPAHPGRKSGENKAPFCRLFSGLSHLVLCLFRIIAFEARDCRGQFGRTVHGD